MANGYFQISENEGKTFAYTRNQGDGTLQRGQTPKKWLYQHLSHIYIYNVKRQMGTVCSTLKKCIQRCFHDEEDDYRERMIQLEQRMLNKSPENSMYNNTMLIDLRKSEVEYFSNHSTPKRNCDLEMHEIKKQIDNDRRRSNVSIQSESYYSINSGSASSHSVSRRSFKSVLKKRPSINLTASKDMNFSKVAEFKQLKQNYNVSGSEQDVTLSRVQSQFNSISQAMFEWNENEYERKTNNFFFQLNPTEELKLSSNIWINQAVNKLQDFYTFHFNVTNEKFINENRFQQKIFSPTYGYYFRKCPELKCFYCNDPENMGQMQTYMLLMKFQSNTSNPIEFLKWYNSIYVQAKLFNIQRQVIIENGTYPIFQVEHFGTDLKEKNMYFTVRQIENVKFDNEPQTEYILQLDTSFRKGYSYKTLIRFSDSENGMVEIYSEISEKIRISPQNYFIKKWRHLEYLIKQRLQKISLSRVVK